MAETVNLKKSYSKLNEALVHHFDQSGVRRSFTVPYVDGQSMAEHVLAVGAAATQSGGLTKNLILTGHHSSGRGPGSGDGHTVGYSADKLRTTIIPKDDENAKAAINAAQKHLNNMAKLLGDANPELKTAKSQLDLVKKSGGAGMSLLNFGVLLTQIMYRPTQAVARAHSGSKGGGHAPQLRAPGQPAAPEASETAPEGQEAAPAEEDASAASAPAAASPAAPVTPPAPVAAAPQA